MTTLANLRAKLNNELGVTDDTNDLTYPKAFRDQAIADGYAELWRAGIYKPVQQDLTAVSDAWTYALTNIRRLRRVELLDSSANILDVVPSFVEDDGSGGYRLRLKTPVASGYTLRVHGWTAYVSVFASDSANDDVPVEWNRVPLLKSKAILFRAKAASFMRYGTRQQAPPEMNVTLDALLGMVAATEREFVEGVRAVKADRARTGQTLSL